MPNTHWPTRRLSRSHDTNFNSRCRHQSSKRLETTIRFSKEIAESRRSIAESQSGKRREERGKSKRQRHLNEASRDASAPGLFPRNAIIEPRASATGFQSRWRLCRLTRSQRRWPASVSNRSLFERNVTDRKQSKRIPALPPRLSSRCRVTRFSARRGQTKSQSFASTPTAMPNLAPQPKGLLNV